LTDCEYWYYSADMKKRGGNNLIEFTFIVPWYVFLFAGAYDMGIYSYSLIGVQNAARVAALVCSTSSSTCSSSTLPCGYALDQLRGLPNVGSATTTCGGNSPVSVSVTTVTGPDGTASGASQVTVSYTTPNLVPIPGMLPGNYTATRTVTMRYRG